jgi:uncharacterized protein
MLASPLSFHDFGEKLHQVVFPAQPIQTVEHLVGRTAELSRIEKALFAPGRHIFIYGDRGVGKSSVAATAANQLQSSDANYIDIACSPDATFKSVIANIAYQAISASRIRSTKRSEQVAIDFRYLKLGKSDEVALHDLPAQIHTLLDAEAILREVAALHSDRPIVVIDEFDRMKDPNERTMFADLVKHIGDKKINIRFIFTGVTRTLEGLLGAHPSSIRQLETIELLKLSWDARWDIAINAAASFGIELIDDIYIRIAAVSDGYPYYVHLITEKILWHAYEDPLAIKRITWEHYHAGLSDAIQSISAELRRPYEMAVNQVIDNNGVTSDDYEEILWSTADSEYLHRHVKDMFSSYDYIMKQRNGRRSLDYETYTTVLKKLRNKSCGQILMTSWYKKPGLLTYRENMLRGYVRMKAESHGIQLIGEQQSVPTQKMHIPSKIIPREYKSSVPKGVHTGRRRDR